MKAGIGMDTATESNTCIVCGQEQKEGIMIVNAFICESCESEIVRTEVEDERYPHFVMQMRKLWYRILA